MVLPVKHTETKKMRMGSHKKHNMKYFVVFVEMMGMGRWNSKGCQTRVKWFKVQRQREEVSLADVREVRETGEVKRHSTLNLIITGKWYPISGDGGFQVRNLIPLKISLVRGPVACQIIRMRPNVPPLVWRKTNPPLPTPLGVRPGNSTEGKRITPAQRSDKHPLPQKKKKPNKTRNDRLDARATTSYPTLTRPTHTTKPVIY
ncbi:hypothetical protein AVEN_101437-1 [Araneus ventricosus]|uniref:Uncharacterized protein n=1 Tax=Araneus ventricosus TaxID=182803 RepID=A0A4Y2CX60_ARAVE|nr:hypothetical protein AVEN_101437-1 [Araneus ventricosus]